MPIRYTISIAFTIAAAAALAQHGSTTRSNPFNTPRDRAEGARVFRGHCAACHGMAGTGGSAGPDLTAGSLRRSGTDEALFQVIAKGIPGTSMPAFGGSGREAWQLAAYVRTLSIGKGAAKAKGDPIAGRRVFDANGCAKCHTAGAPGGTIGPDLGNVGAQRSLGDLQRSVLHPDDEVSPDYWVLRARTKAGEEISGIRLNEDTFSFQYRTGASLRSVLKQDLAESRTATASVMPSYAGKIDGKNLEDLIAWLASQRKDTGQ